MERDFMGLNPKDPAVKEEFIESACEDSGFSRSCGAPRSSSNKASALHEFMSLRCKQDEKPTKNGLPAYPVNPFPMKQHSLGGNTSAPSTTGTTEQWINSKASNASAQLTIFYGGTVTVFDDISPEKAQAIMLLTRNIHAQSKMTESKLHMQEPASKLPTPDQPLANQSMNTPPSSELPSPMSVSSHPIDQPGASNDDVKVSKTAAMSSPHVNDTDSPKRMSQLRSVPAPTIMSSAVPQARKASLTRFLEKRKERVMNAAPYKQGKNGCDCKTPDSNDLGLSATTS